MMESGGRLETTVRPSLGLDGAFHQRGGRRRRYVAPPRSLSKEKVLLLYLFYQQAWRYYNVHT